MKFWWFVGVLSSEIMIPFQWCKGHTHKMNRLSTRNELAGLNERCRKGRGDGRRNLFCSSNQYKTKQPTWLLNMITHSLPFHSKTFVNFHVSVYHRKSNWPLFPTIMVCICVFWTPWIVCMYVCMCFPFPSRLKNKRALLLELCFVWRCLCTGRLSLFSFPLTLPSSSYLCLFF